MTSSNSAVSKAPISCQSVSSLLETFVDGELPPDQTLSVEAHLNACVNCHAVAEFQQVLGNSVERAVHDDKPANPEFLARLNVALEAEIAREIASTHKPTTLSWQSKASAFALAAGVAAWFTVKWTASNDNKLTVAASTQTQNAVSPDVPVPAAAQVTPVVAKAEPTVPALAKAKPVEDDSLEEDRAEEVTLEGALDRLIDVHSKPPKPQITTAELLPAIEPEIGVRIELPKLERYGARWEGASVVPVRKNQHAASLRYRMPNHRMTLYVFDASKLHVRPPEQPRGALNAPLYVGQWRGYTVAAKENRGVGYALAADMDDVAVTRLISAIH